MSSLKKFCTESFAIHEFIQMEVTISQCLNWKLILPTAANFTDFYVMESLSDEDFHAGAKISCLVKARAYLRKYAEYFVEISLQGEEFYVPDVKPTLLYCFRKFLRFKV